MPILSNVLVIAKDKITLRATNLVVDLQTSFDAEIEKEGEVVVSPSQLVGFLVANSGQVSVNIAKMMSVKAGVSQIKLSTMDAEEFPQWQQFEPLSSFTIEKAKLRDMLDSVSFAVAKDARRPILTGTYFNAPHKLIVGADGIRMAMVDFELGGEFGVVISQQGIEEVKRMALLTNNDIEVKIGEKFSSFSSENYRIIVNHLAGEYPTNAIGLAQTIKQRDHNVVVKMKKDSLLKVFGVANLFQTGLLSVPLRLNCDKNIEVEIESDAGSYKDKVEGKVEKGTISILLSPTQIIDAVNQVKANEVIFQMGTPHQPIVILDPNNENWSMIQVSIADRERVEEEEKQPKVEEMRQTNF